MQLQTALEPVRDRIVILDKAKRRYDARPLEDAGHDVIGEERPLPAQEWLPLDHGAQGDERIAKRLKPLLAPPGDILKRATEARLAGLAEIGLVIFFQNRVYLRQKRSTDKRDKRCIGPFLDETGQRHATLSAKQAWPIRVGLFQMQRDGKGIADKRFAIPDQRNRFRGPALNCADLCEGHRDGREIEPLMRQRKGHFPAMRAERTRCIHAHQFIKCNGHNSSSRLRLALSGARGFHNPFAMQYAGARFSCSSRPDKAMKQQFQMLAAYNLWANARIYDAAETLDADALDRDIGLYFKSLLGTLNHILVGDLIWMKRFTGEGASPGALDTVLHSALPALRIAREGEDKRIVEWIDSLDAAAFSGRFTYVTVTDVRTVSQRLAPALVHFFNHQTHHRGQAHAALSILGAEAPSLDLIYFHRTKDGVRFA